MIPGSGGRAASPLVATGHPWGATIALWTSGALDVLDGTKARLTDIVLPDQHRRTIALHAERAGRRAMVVFHRSAAW